MEGEQLESDENDASKKFRQERKELQAKIQSLKKSVPKGDKKKKKEIAEEISKLELELKEKLTQEHNQTLTDVKDDNNDSNHVLPEDVDEQGENNDNGTPSDNTRVSRAQRRRNKKASEEKDREKRITEQSELNKKGARVTEMNQIKEKLKTMNLEIYDIEADGNCLYCAIIHQLELTNRQKYNVKQLRNITAQFIRDHKDDFLPFMYNEMDESVVISDEHFESYCAEVANTKLWGGQLELRALSNSLMCPIKIIQASGPPTVQGESFNGPELIITYHRHLYRLGEHYNSTVPNDQNPDEDV